MNHSAPIYAHAERGPASPERGEGSAAADQAAWAHLAQPAGTREFCASWLAILCLQVPRVGGAMVLLQEGSDGSYTPAALWPDAGRDLTHLGPAAEAALRERRGVVLPAAGPDGTSGLGTRVGYPIEVDGTLHGAVVLDLLPRHDTEVQLALRLVHWGSAWLLDHFRQRLVAHERQSAQRLGLATEVMAVVLQERRLGAAGLALANDLAARLSCQRVAIGLERAGTVRVRCISHTATFDPRSDTVRQLADAMEEAWDLDMTQVHPPLQPDAVGGLAQAALSGARGGAAVMSVPMRNDGAAVGVVTLERDPERPFTAEDRLLCESLCTLVGPVIDLKRLQDRPWWRKLADATQSGVRALMGPQHPGLKLIALVLLAVLAFLSLADGTHRVSARTVVEGEVQRALVAPFDGFVLEAPVRAGDRVVAGQVLARLDDRDLRLERARQSAEADQAQRRYRQAAAAGDRAAMAVAAAQAQQAEAMLALVEERIARATVRAPFDGIVVLGDLSQTLGSPTEQGKVLFEVAPLDAWRVVLQVDERDIGVLAEGQRGELALAGLPQRTLPFEVQRITPVAEAGDGGNHFRVEARLADGAPTLRPGMEGVGKIEVGERRLIWIWTHPFTDWLRLWAWRWFG